MKLKLFILIIIFTATYFFVFSNKTETNIDVEKSSDTSFELSTTSDIVDKNIKTDSKEIINDSNVKIPLSKNLSGFSWVGQTFNNCSSVGLMIALSYWGITDTQEKIAEGTRPWNNKKGDNDDKSVTLYELADYAKENHGVLTYVRPNGDIDTLKKFIANDIPVLSRTLMYPLDDIVHYRVVRGYDDKKKIIIESDGYYGREHEYTYEEWMHLWKDFNYSYLIVVPKNKQQLVEKLLGEELDEQIAWNNAKARAIDEVSKDSSNLRAKYNEITALYYLNDYKGVIREFEKIEDKLTRRKLWYQIEPIDSYFKLKQYDRVIELVDVIENDNNKSISELYVLRGKIYEIRGDIAKAKVEYEKAVYYNKSLKSAKEALALLSL